MILSGTASDGTVGLQAIKAAGGITFAQDAGTAKCDGMPRSAIASGVVDYVLRPAEIALQLMAIGRHVHLSSEPRRRLNRRRMRTWPGYSGWCESLPE